MVVIFIKIVEFCIKIDEFCINNGDFNANISRVFFNGDGYNTWESVWGGAILSFF